MDRQPNLLWYFGDYPFYCAYESLSGYDYYVIVEYDVEFVLKSPDFLETVLARMAQAEPPYDLVATHFDAAHRHWTWVDTCKREFEDVFGIQFSFVILSSSAIKYLFAARRREARREKPNEGFMFCEAFVPSALKAAGLFRCADVNDLVTNAWKHDSFGILNLLLLNNLPADVADFAMAHPVFSEREYIARRMIEAKRDGQTSEFIAFLRGTQAQTINAELRERALAELLPPPTKAELHSLYTQDTVPLLIRLSASLRDDIAVVATDISATSKFGGPDGIPWTQGSKIQLLCDLSDPGHRPDDGIVLVCDVDIVFHDRIMPIVTEYLAMHGLLFQRGEMDTDRVDLGIIAFRPGPAIHEFWMEVHRRVVATGQSDQEVVNTLLADSAAMAVLGIKPGRLPASVFCNAMGFQHAAYGATIAHHANALPSIREKWLSLSVAAGVLAAPDDCRGVAARKTVLALLYDAEWQFGALGRAEPYGTMRLTPGGMISGYHHPNEARHALAAAGLVFVGEAGIATTLFDEFYVDPIGGRVMMVGYAPLVAREASPHIHYLIAKHAASS